MPFSFLVQSGINSWVARLGTKLIDGIYNLYHPIGGILLASTKYGKRWLVMKN